MVIVAMVFGVGVAKGQTGSQEEYLFEDTLSHDVDSLDYFTEDDSTSTLAQEVRDSLLNLPAGYVPKATMALLADRLGCIQGEIPLTLNPKVASFIDYFVVRNRRYTQMVLERKDFYFPIFEKYLKQYGLPDELKYLAIVESGLNYAAVSRVGAVGLWQFMPVTGKECGLQVDHYFDERLEAERATEAACKYLKRLYRVLGDWELVLASYNCGVGKVGRIVKATGKRNFWELYDRLPLETRAYVPQFVALTYAVNYHKEHNIFPEPDSLLTSIPYDTLLVNQHVNLYQLAGMIGSTPKVLRQLNPTLRRHATPHNQPYVLRVPAESKPFLALNRQEILDSASSPVDEQLLPVYLRGKRQREAKPLLASAKHQKGKRNKRGKVAEEQLLAQAKHTTKPVAKVAAADSSRQLASANTDIVHKVEAGQGLFGVARQYQVTVAQLREWNNLADDAVLLAGQKLLVKAAAHDNTPANNTSTQLAYAAKQSTPDPAVVEETIVDKGSTVKLVSNKASKEDTKQSKRVKGRTYRVQPGDTLWAIAQKHEMSLDEIVRLNNLKGRKLTPGQKLILGA